MSQKTNPISLRLQKTNQHFLSSWYSDFFYTAKNCHDLQIRTYLEDVCEQIAHSQMFLHLQHHYRRMYTLLFFFDSRGIRNRRDRTLRLPHRALRRAQPTQIPIAFLTSCFSRERKRREEKKRLHLDALVKPRAPLKSNASLELFQGGFINSNSGGGATFLNWGSLHSTLQSKDLDPILSSLSILSCFAFREKMLLHAHAHTCFSGGNIQKDSSKLAVLGQPLLEKKLINKLALNLYEEYPKYFTGKHVSPDTLFRSHLEKTLNQHSFASHTIFPIRVIEDAQSAHFLAKELAHLLQRGATFRQAQDQILNERIQNESIKGIRLSCSGRVGGRSKKAQKSKTQSMQWGETSLHVFSSKLAFACAAVRTPQGQIGIKLWLCLK